MGIKFLCPNGHKLHVKAFLSGKRAICPKCGARVIVPEAAPEAVLVRPDGDVGSSATAPSSVDTLEAALVDDVLESLSVDDVATRRSGAGGGDPISEAPSAVWYVRPASGGQYGPASGPVMRDWIQDGRVAGNSLVWRDGWEQWRTAAEAFPQLGSQLAPPVGPAANGMPPLPASLPLGQVVEGVASVPPSINHPAPLPPMATAVRKRRRKNDLRLMASIGLAVLSLILVIVLVLVFRAQNDPAKTADSPPPAQDSKSGDEPALD